MKVRIKETRMCAEAIHYFRDGDVFEEGEVYNVIEEFQNFYGRYYTISNGVKSGDIEARFTETTK